MTNRYGNFVSVFFLFIFLNQNGICKISVFNLHHCLILFRMNKKAENLKFHVFWNFDDLTDVFRFRVIISRGNKKKKNHDGFIKQMKTCLAYVQPLRFARDPSWFLQKKSKISASRKLMLKVRLQSRVRKYERSQVFRLDLLSCCRVWWWPRPKRI